MKTYYDKDTQRVPLMVWATDLDDGALQQLLNLSRMPYVFHHVAAMPDAHVGIGATIGSVFASEYAVVPSAVGVDIGCGMCALPTRHNVSDLPKARLFERAIETVFRAIPTGFAGHQKARSWKRKTQFGGFDYESQDAGLTNEIQKNAPKKLGSLGGGNHFIEFQREHDGTLWIMLHSGSRNVGKMIAQHWMKVAKKTTGGEGIPADLSYLDVNTREGRGYLSDMQWALAYALENRLQMMETVFDVLTDVFPREAGMAFDADINDLINIHHNYASEERHFGKMVWVHRKGATLASEGTIGIIPGSMGTHSYIVRGQGSEESFRSCSHGAGRRMSRHDALKSISRDDLDRALGNVRLRAGSDVRDEAPQAYKSIDEVMENQKDLVDILVELSPLATVKG